MIRLVILDRDGVLNADRVDSVKNPDELLILPGVAAAVAALNQSGYKVVIATNQSVLGRGIIDETMFARIQEKLLHALAVGGGRIDRVYVAPDHPDRPTIMRKPGPGMILQALADFATPPHEAIMIGDALRDLQAAHQAGVHKILVQTGRGHGILPHELLAVQPFRLAADLPAAIRELCHFS